MFINTFFKKLFKKPTEILNTPVTRPLAEVTDTTVFSKTESTPEVVPSKEEQNVVFSKEKKQTPVKSKKNKKVKKATSVIKQLKK
jgi:hypothetical protein